VISYIGNILFRYLATANCSNLWICGLWAYSFAVAVSLKCTNGNCHSNGAFTHTHTRWDGLRWYRLIQCVIASTEIVKSSQVIDNFAAKVAE